MPDWKLLSNHGRVLFCVARDPGVRLRDLANQLSLTERTAYGIVTDLAKAGVVTKERDGRRNRYHIHRDRPFDTALDQGVTLGDLLALFDCDGTIDAYPVGGNSE